MDGNSSSTERRLKVRYLFGVEQEPLENVTVAVRDGIAVNVEDAAHDVDLGNVAIIPGLVNAHTHLEFSTLDDPLLGEDSTSFSDWIRAVLKWRSQRDADAPESHQIAIAQGLAESHKHGTTLMGEIATQPFWPEIYQATDLNGVRFLELIGLSSDRIDDQVRQATEYLGGAGESPPGWQAGLSPHAPYTVGWRLLNEVVQISRRLRAPVAMHLAETFDELQLLSAHSGPLVELLSERGVWDPSAIPRGVEPVAYLELLSQAHRALVIHGNYLQHPEWEFLAKHRERLTVVYCPRTFAYFGHRQYPLEEMLHHGVHVAVGTDSRASNPDLDLFAELKFIRQQHPDVDLETILRLGTKNGADALGFGALVRPMALVALPDADSLDPYELLFDVESQIIVHGNA